MKITRSEINRHPDRWVRYTNGENKEVFREKKEFGNRHAIFDLSAETGIVHVDLYNALDFPIGTVNHIAKWTNEKFGINENVARIGLYAIGLYGAYKLGKSVLK